MYVLPSVICLIIIIINYKYETKILAIFESIFQGPKLLQIILCGKQSMLIHTLSLLKSLGFFTYHQV